MSVPDPTQVQAALAGIATAAAAAAPALAPVNPQAAAVAAMIPIANQALQDALTGLNQGQLTTDQVVAQAKAIAAAIEATHNGWAALNQAKGLPAATSA